MENEVHTLCCMFCIALSIVMSYVFEVHTLCFMVGLLFCIFNSITWLLSFGLWQLFSVFFMHILFEHPIPFSFL